MWIVRRCIGIMLLICAGNSSCNNMEIAVKHEPPRAPRPHSVQLQDVHRPNMSNGCMTFDPDCTRFNLSTDVNNNLTADINTITSAQHSTHYQISPMQSRRLLTREDGYQEWLHSVLGGKELGLELTSCTLQLALDPFYLTSPFMTYIDNLPHLKQVVVVREAKDFLKMMWGDVMCRVYVFLFLNSQPLLSFADSDPLAWDYYARYIVLGLSRADLKALSQTRMGRKTQHILGVIKSASDGMLKIFTNGLYTNEGVVYLSSWYPSQSNQQTHYFKDKTSNLQGTMLNVATFEFPPAIMYRRQDGKKSISRYGGEVAVMKALANVMNFTINFVEPPPGELWGSRLSNGTWNGIVGMQGRGEADLAIANVFITNLPGQSEHQHFSAPFYHEVSCVVMKVPPPMPRWQAISWPFRGETWLTILIGFFICGPILYVVAFYSAARVGSQPFLKSLPSSYFYAFAMHLREPTDRQPNTTSSQISVGFMWLYVMVIGITYSTNLTAFLTVTRQPKVIDTIKDFHDSGFAVVGLGPIFGNLMQRSENYYLKSLYSRFVALISDPEVWVMKGQAGYINSYHSTTYLVAQVNSEYRKPIFRLMKECTWPFSVGVALQSYSPLKSRVDQVINRIVESGLVAYWFQEAVRIATQHGQNRKKKNMEGGEATTKNEVSEYGNYNMLVPLNTDHMQGVFYIMLLSLLSGLMVFLAEVVFGNHCQSRY